MLEHDNQAHHSGGDEVEKIDENDRVIKSIQDIREKLIKDLLVDGKAPDDPETRSFLIQLMNGSTSTAMGGKKIKSAEKQAVNQIQITKNMAEAARMVSSQQSAGRRQAIKEARVVPKVPVHNVPGHQAIGTFPISTTSVANGGNGGMAI